MSPSFSHVSEFFKPEHSIGALFLKGNASPSPYAEFTRRFSEAMADIPRAIAAGFIREFTDEV